MTACKDPGPGEDLEKATSVDTSIVQVSDPRQRLADAESDIACSNASFHQPTQIRDHPEEETDTHYAPILRLPLEISSQIFIDCLSDNIWDDVNQFVSPQMFGQVCSSWRRLASSIPTLWRSLQLDLDKAHPLDAVLVDQWLLRSGKLPLSIYASGHIQPPSPVVIAIIDVIARHSERWSRIAFTLPYRCYENLEAIKNCLPNLEFISLNSESWDWNEVSAFFGMFSIAPRLRNVSLEGYHLQSFVFPTHQIAKLYVGLDYVDECVDFLRRCPHVIEVSMRCITSWDIGASNLHAAQLESLDLCAGHGTAPEIFDLLTLPALRKLSCTPYHKSSNEFPHTNFISLISRSSCSLHKLSLNAFRLSLANLIECLRAVPSLCQLSLSNIGIGNEAFQILNSNYSHNHDDSNCLLPNLKEFQYAGTFDLDFVVLGNLLRSRWEAEEFPELLKVSRLESCKVTTSVAGTPDPPLLNSFRSLVQQGMVIQLVTADGSWP
jgi:hypothetical protein